MTINGEYYYDHIDIYDPEKKINYKLKDLYPETMLTFEKILWIIRDLYIVTNEVLPHYFLTEILEEERAEYSFYELYHIISL
jgi:hypothetical protein